MMLALDLYPLSTDGSFPISRSHAFRFEPFWHTNAPSSTSSTDTFLENLSECGHQLKLWGTSSFGQLPRRISTLQTKSSQMNSFPINNENLINIRQMQTELDHLLVLEESY